MGQSGSKSQVDTKSYCRVCSATIGATEKLCSEHGKVTLCIWPMTDSKNGGNWGHAALKVPVGNTYVSWWPAKRGSKSKAGLSPQKGSPQSYEADKQCEGGKTPKTYKIYVGYEGQCRIKNWWNSFKKNSEYCAVGMNCAKAVVTALKKGGRSFSFKVVGPWMPNDIWESLQ